MRGSFLVLETNYVERELSQIILQLCHPGSGCEGTLQLQTKLVVCMSAEGNFWLIRWQELE